MIYAMLSPAFMRAWKSGRFTNRTELRRAAMLGERFIVDHTLFSGKIQVTGVIHNRGVAGELFMYPNGHQTMLNRMIENEEIAKANENVQAAIYLRSKAIEEKLDEVEKKNVQVREQILILSKKIEGYGKDISGTDG